MARRDNSRPSAALKLTTASLGGFAVVVPVLATVLAALAEHGLLTADFLPLLMIGVPSSAAVTIAYIVANAWLKRAELDADARQAEGMAGELRLTVDRLTAEAEQRERQHVANRQADARTVAEAKQAAQAAEQRYQTLIAQLAAANPQTPTKPTKASV